MFYKIKQVSLQLSAPRATRPYICIINKTKKTMKTRSLFIAALVVMSAVVSAIGKEEPSKAGLAVVPVKGKEVFKVIYKGENVGKVKLNIYNVMGSVVFSETINNVDGFIRPLNFNGLESGDYTVELIDAAGKRVEKISYLPKVSTFEKNVRVIKMEESKFIVSVANTGTEVVNVKIYDAANNLVHSESKEISGNFAQVYSIKNITPGFTFEVADSAGNSKTVKY